MDDPKVKTIVSRIKDIDWKAVDAGLEETPKAPEVTFDELDKNRPKNTPRAPDEPERNTEGCWHTSTGIPKSFLRP